MGIWYIVSIRKFNRRAKFDTECKFDTKTQQGWQTIKVLLKLVTKNYRFAYPMPLSISNNSHLANIL